MNRNLTFTSAVVVTALSLAALPAAAQDHRDGRQQRGGGHATASQAAPRQAPRETSAQGRQSAPRAPENRSSSASQAAAPRAPENRPNGGQGAAPRAYQSRPEQGQSRPAPRSYNAPSPRYGGGTGLAASGYRGDGSRPSVVRPYFSRPYVRPHGWAPYRSYRFSQPYYAFSPWLTLGFGLWVGYPVPYPWGYLGDYQPTVFGEYPNDSYQVAPGAPSSQEVPDSSTYGGASFDIQPADADLFVDGQYVGPVGNFGPNSEPLTLASGPHRLAIQHDGFRPMEWDVTVDPGQVIPYRGVLERQ
jgi:hypothetical protein